MEAISSIVLNKSFYFNFVPNNANSIDLSPTYLVFTQDWQDIDTSEVSNLPSSSLRVGVVSSPDLGH